MNLSINPRHFLKAAVGEEERTILEALDLVREAGFRHLDLEAESPEEAEAIASYVKEHDLKIIQSHIPFNRYKREDNAVFYQKVMAGARYAKTMGSEILVVHADEYPYWDQAYTSTAAQEYNYRYFSELVDFAVKNGMRVAFENTFQEWSRIKTPHYGALVEDLCAFVDRFATNSVGICWDTGHAHVQYGKQDVNALKVAGDRVICTHIHDNYYDEDLHCFPFMGEIDWKTLMATLREIGYRGDFSFELVYDRLPKALAPDYLKLLYRTGEYMLEKM